LSLQLQEGALKIELFRQELVEREVRLLPDANLPTQLAQETVEGG
jgi:hypothetical protein